MEEQSGNNGRAKRRTEGRANIRGSREPYQHLQTHTHTHRVNGVPAMARSDLARMVSKRSATDRQTATTHKKLVVSGIRHFFSFFTYFRDSILDYKNPRIAFQPCPFYSTLKKFPH